MCVLWVFHWEKNYGRFCKRCSLEINNTLSTAYICLIYYKLQVVTKAILILREQFFGGRIEVFTVMEIQVWLSGLWRRLVMWWVTNVLEGVHPGRHSTSSCSVSINDQFQVPLTSPWRWREQSSPKRRYPTTTLHGVTTQKTTTWIFIPVKTWKDNKVVPVLN